MVATMTHLEARERLVAKVVNQRQKTLESLPKHDARQRTSPSAHYHISKYPKCLHDIFAWIDEHDTSLAIKVSTQSVCIPPTIFIAS
jgi:hypothetical protein